MTAILARHDEVRALFDNGWLHLFQIGVDGTLAKRYAGNLEWVEFDAPAGAGFGEGGMTSM